MTATFKTPPLVELIAEIRWTLLQLTTQGVQLPPNMPLPVAQNAVTDHEALFLNYAAHVSAHGYKRVERIVPIGFPMMSYQPVCRYRPESPGTLYQLGAGVFTANAIQPYESWGQFSPIVDNGLIALFECLTTTDKQGIRQLSLRYIDAFKGKLQLGQTIWEFVNDTLGIKIALPTALTEHCTDKTAVKLTCRFSIPVKMGVLEVQVAEGLVNNNPAYIMDTTVKIDQGISPDKDVIMMHFNAAHDIIHRMFFEISKPLHQSMEPLGSN